MMHCISTHAPLAGRDGIPTEERIGERVFQPTRPLRGATAVLCTPRRLTKFQPTRPLRGATTRERVKRYRDAFQPTRPLRGATRGNSGENSLHRGFQPTRPLRGATILDRDALIDQRDFNPRAPCGARQCWILSE